MPTFDWSPNQACDWSSKCWVVVTCEDHELSLFGCDILVENEKSKRLPEIARLSHMRNRRQNPPPLISLVSGFPDLCSSVHLRP
ncbi:hypothetical protein Hanom_Chr08g00708261 [Helianthus anomalus]